jgi:ferredoxin
MPYVVTAACKGCKYTDCVVVCPVDCFYEGSSMLYIHPDECIDCDACVNECPVNAIYEQVNLPSSLLKWIQINEDESKSGNCPSIVSKKKNP